MGSEAWSNGSVRASGAEGSEFEPTFCHSLLSGGPWQDLVSSVRLEPLNYDGVVYHQEGGVERSPHCGHFVVARRRIDELKASRRWSIVIM